MVSNQRKLGLLFPQDGLAHSAADMTPHAVAKGVIWLTGLDIEVMLDLWRMGARVVDYILGRILLIFYLH